MICWHQILRNRRASSFATYAIARETRGREDLASTDRVVRHTMALEALRIRDPEVLATQARADPNMTAQEVQTIQGPVAPSTMVPEDLPTTVPVVLPIQAQGAPATTDLAAHAIRVQVAEARTALRSASSNRLAVGSHLCPADLMSFADQGRLDCASKESLNSAFDRPSTM